ncbi:hypothetical protein PV08_07629 [Exophiala spinifera]|uniref:Zn(2)-C6 fungal-type domain-containing protein n=1 Tax=Exophiala spinifera TaxID=91928 RepID=A0A0D2BU88_9EURO|nr:uncharacterized protein PV08_07629 [Exophiala spinifera]KIW14844.1 hypothetical protein PV08_07629 [Exophiala spinifera]
MESGDQVLATTEKPPLERPAKAFSCIRCFERKVKCDKQHPCSNCSKSQVECTFRVPPAPRRRKKRLQEDVLLERLRKCELLLKAKGLSLDDGPGEHNPSSLSSPTDPASTGEPDFGGLPYNRSVLFPELPGKRSGQLLMEGSKSRFVENNLWASVSGEFQPNDALTEEYSDEGDYGSPEGEGAEFVLGHTPGSNRVSQLHPPPDHIMLLWQSYLDSFNPLTKLVHQPTLEKSIIEASADLDNVPRSLEALMFSVYSAAVYTMEDDECIMKFGEERKVLLSRYRYASRKALSRAKFMATSDLQVLAAFVIYMLTMREVYDSRTVWALAGVASRIAQGMGLHRDGTTLGTPPFETEMRRRIWWQVTTLDFRSGELSGSGRFSDFDTWDTKPPTNVNDVDIWPGMTEPPVPSPRPTDMIACLLRTEFGTFWKQKITAKSKITLENLRLDGPFNSTLEERDANINELESILEEKYLKYCDPSIPVQFMCILMGRGAVTSMRLMAHHPRKYANPADVPESERKYLWQLSLKLLEGYNLAHSTKYLRKFMWHTRNFFGWQALIYILNELKTETIGEKADHAWNVVDEVFFHQRNFVTDYKRPLHAAAGSLLLKAYSAREAALREKTNGLLPRTTPEYITILRDQRKANPPTAQMSTAQPQMTSTSTSPSVFTSQTPSDAWQGGSSAMYQSQQPPQADRYSAPRKGQLPLPNFIPPQVPASFQTQHIRPEQVMYASDPSLANELALADMPMDWASWDLMMQDSSWDQPGGQ